MRKNKLFKVIQKKRFDKKENNDNLNLNKVKFINIYSNINQLKQDLNSNNHNLIIRALSQIKDYFQEIDFDNEKEINFFFENLFEEITKILLKKKLFLLKFNFNNIYKYFWE